MNIEKTKIVGVSFDNRQEHIKDINDMIDELIAVREPKNPYDKNAIHIYIKTEDGQTTDDMKSCGYINRHLAKDLAPLMDDGKELIIRNYYIMGNGDSPLGVMIEYSLE